MHPVLTAAAQGRLPDWAQASASRQDHMARVASLMVEWGRGLGLDDEVLYRWRAAGMLHDALRDADPESLKPLAPADFVDLPGSMLHGPVAAARLQADGVADEAVLAAVRWHTLGHPDLDALGRALYIADYTDPGRTSRVEERAALRDRMPGELEAVVLDVARARLRLTVDGGYPLREPTVAFWNGLVTHG